MTDTLAVPWGAIGTSTAMNTAGKGLHLVKCCSKRDGDESYDFVFEALVPSGGLRPGDRFSAKVWRSQVHGGDEFSRESRAVKLDRMERLAVPGGRLAVKCIAPKGIFTRVQTFTSEADYYRRYGLWEAQGRDRPAALDSPAFGPYGEWLA